jgi:hypothetical protein
MPQETYSWLKYQSKLSIVPRTKFIDIEAHRLVAVFCHSLLAEIQQSAAGREEKAEGDGEDAHEQAAMIGDEEQTVDLYEARPVRGPASGAASHHRPFARPRMLAGGLLLLRERACACTSSMPNALMQDEDVAKVGDPISVLVRMTSQCAIETAFHELDLEARVAALALALALSFPTLCVGAGGHEAHMGLPAGQLHRLVH